MPSYVIFGSKWYNLSVKIDKSGVDFRPDPERAFARIEVPVVDDLTETYYLEFVCFSLPDSCPDNLKKWAAAEEGKCLNADRKAIQIELKRQDYPYSPVRVLSWLCFIAHKYNMKDTRSLGQQVVGKVLKELSKYLSVCMDLNPKLEAEAKAILKWIANMPQNESELADFLTELKAMVSCGGCRKQDFKSLILAIGEYRSYLWNKLNPMKFKAARLLDHDIVIVVNRRNVAFRRHHCWGRVQTAVSFFVDDTWFVWDTRNPAVEKMLTHCGAFRLAGYVGRESTYHGIDGNQVPKSKIRNVSVKFLPARGVVDEDSLYVEILNGNTFSEWK